MSARSALEKYSRRHAGIKKREPKEKKKVQKENGTPEGAVQKEVLDWCKQRGFDISVVESKAVYSRSAGRYLRGQTEAGFSDLVGVSPNGRAVFIELKALGKRSTLKPHQYDFLLRKIKLFAFAVCVDSVRSLDDAFNTWSNLIHDNPDQARMFLEEHLPKSRRTKEMLDDELKF